MDSEHAEQTNQSLMRILRRRAPAIVICILVFGAAAYGYAKHQTKQYTAVAALAFNNNPLDEEIAGLSSNGTTVDLLAQQNSNRELVKLGSAAAMTAHIVGHGLTEEEVSDSLSISAVGETSIVQVAATWPSPVLAAAIANTYTSAFFKEQKATNQQYFKSALRLVNRQLAKLSPAQRFGTDGLGLQERAQTLSLLAELGFDNVQVAQDATVPSSPSSPKVHSDAILGALLGLLVGVGIAFLLERFDRRLREPRDLEAIYGLPILGVVPKSSALSRPRNEPHGGGKGSALPPAEAEAFSLIRAHLRFFNVNRDLRTVIVASPAPGDGKTTIARHLAEAAALLGSRVLLLEGDLRRPTIAQQLYVQGRPGLAEVLIDAVSVESATQTVDLHASSGEGITGRALHVLVAGTVPPNPGELLESRAMEALLEKVRANYDLVVVDTPPLTAVSDAFPLLTKVDGVIIVGWVGHSRREPAEQLHQILASSGAPLLGVIANGSKSGGPGSYVEPRSNGAAGFAPAEAPAVEGLVPTANS
jgi:polysaccharide biosynthesis transport protein